MPDDLNLAVSLFFITFILFQPPSAAVGRWLGGKHWIPVMMVRGTRPKNNATTAIGGLTNSRTARLGLCYLGAGVCQGPWWVPSPDLLVLFRVDESPINLCVVGHRFTNRNPPPDRRLRSRILPHRRGIPLVLLLPIRPRREGRALLWPICRCGRLFRGHLYVAKRKLRLIPSKRGGVFADV